MEVKRKRKLPENPDMSSLEPGAKVMMGKILRKVPWTRRKVENRYKMITFMPECTDSIVWNGVRYDVFEGMEATIPQPHYEEYLARRKAEHAPKSSMQVIGGQVISVQHAAGLRGFPDNPERGQINLRTLSEGIGKE